MIAKLTGRLDESGADWAVIDVQGVGYLVHCSSKTLAALGLAGDEVTVFTDLQVSENDMRLLGFAQGTERDWFRLLTTVQGVGPKLAGRIVNELKDKAGALPGAPAGVTLASVSQPGTASADAVSALQNLGFKPAVAASAVAHAQADLGEGAGLNDLVRVALKRAAG
jgi:Holliday junction DNA helicase RuvA